MASQSYGRHLHSQIVLPLVVGCLCVAIAATFVAVSQLQSVIDDWIASNAHQAAHAIREQFDATGNHLASDIKLVAAQGTLQSAIRVGDWERVRSALVAVRSTGDADDIVVLDETGRVVVEVGEIPVDPGTRLFAKKLSTGVVTARAGLMRVGGQDMIGAVRHVGSGPDGHDYWFLMTRRITWDFLRDNCFRGTVSAVGYCDSEGRLRARYISHESVQEPNATLSRTRLEQTRVRFSETISMGNARIVEAMNRPAMAIGYRLRDGKPFTVLSLEVPFSPEMTTIQPVTRVHASAQRGYVFVVMDGAVAADARRTTIGLVAGWSALAVLALAGLGLVIARKVSVPLAALSEGARRVADGDFGTKVDVSGATEVAELALSFNGMTDSLRDRTETLTKKVLELATLYEMSGALGTTLDLDVLLDSVLDSGMRIFSVDSGYIMLRDKVSGSLELRAWRGKALRPDDRAVRSSMSEWVVRQGRPLIYNPSLDEGGGDEEQVDALTGALAALCVPLVSSDGVIGSICVGSGDRDYRFGADDVRLLSTIANHVTIAIGNIELFSSLQDAYLATVRSLAAAVDAKDPFTRGHSDRVALHAKTLADDMGLSTEQSTALEMAAYLHDIGKIGVRESILLKPGGLDPEEMGQMRHHPLIGANILRPVAFPWPIAPIVRHHHEHYDGSGYPAGLKGEEIPLLARVLTIADAYEAMTADRPYRRGRTQEEAVNELLRCKASQFDPRLVDAFVDILSQPGDGGVARRSKVLEEIQPEEARAVFVALYDGMFASFRRLGGPRLASNLETSLNAFFLESGIPFAMRQGHLNVDWAEAATVDSQLDDSRAAVRKMAALMESTAGRSLVDHFYDEAVAALSERMRNQAAMLDLYERD